MDRHGLTDREWARLGPLPPRRGRTGRPPRDHRLVLDALLWLARTGAPWRDLPGRFGSWRTVATRFYRWTRSGLWERLLAELRRIADAGGGVDRDVHMVDGTSVRAHRCAAGGKGGGSGSKLRVRCDRRGRPMAFVPTPGERNEKAALPELMRLGAVKRPGPGRPKLRPRAVVGDRGYGGGRRGTTCAGAGSVPSFPSSRPRRRRGSWIGTSTASATWSRGWSGA